MELAGEKISIGVMGLSVQDGIGLTGTRVSLAPASLGLRGGLRHAPDIGLRRKPLEVKARAGIAANDDERFHAAYGELRPHPYVGYVRRFTQEGGIAMTFRDIDERFILKAAKVLIWFAAMAASLAILNHTPLVEDDGSRFIVLVAAGCLYAWLLRRPTEITRTIEIRQDCMILDGVDVYWAEFMEVSLPGFSKNDEGHLVLGGVYGTRWIDYLTVRRFDEFDRTPDVLSSHVTDAMRKLWSPQGR